MENLIIKKTINAHSNYVSYLCIIKNNRFASCSFDHSIKIFNSENLECEYNIIVHNKYVKFITQLKNENILSCSCDKTLKIIELKENRNFNVIQTLYGHQSTVSFAVELNSGKIISCSKDLTMRIWVKNKNINLYQCECILNFIKERIYSIFEIISNKMECKLLLYYSNLSFLCENEFCVYKKIHLKKPIKNFNVICQIDNKFLLCEEHSISIYDVNFIQKINEIKVKNNIEFISKLRNQTFFSQTENGTLTLYNIEENGNNFEYITKIKDYNLFSFSSLFLIQINVNQFALSLINEYVITILEIENIKN